MSNTKTGRAYTNGKRDEYSRLLPLLERCQRAIWDFNQLHPHSSLDKLLVDIQNSSKRNGE